MQRHVKHEIMLGVFFFLVIGLLVYMFHAIGGQTATGRIRINAYFDSAMGLVADNYVMVAGVPVGAVKAISVEDSRARVEMSVDASVGLKQGSVARIRAKSLLGEKFVELIPASGDGVILNDGDTLAETRSSVEIDEILITLRPFFARLEPMAPEIESLLGELDTLLKQVNATGRAKRETIETIIDRTDKLLETSNRLLEKNEQKITKTVDNLDQVVAVTSDRAPELLRRAERTLSKIEAAADAVPVGTLQKIPDTYERVDEILGRLVPLAKRLEANGDRIDKILKNLDILLQRVIQIDELALRRFLQQEGVNVNLTQDAASRRRIEDLEADQAGQTSGE